MRVFQANAADPTRLSEVAGHLEGGGLLCHPTETVYGLAAAANATGVAALRALKGRSDDRPFLVLLPGLHEAASAGMRWSPRALALAERYWPGPLTLVLDDPELRYPVGVRSSTGGIAVRVSPHPFVQALMKQWGRALLSTSANVHGEGTIGRANDVQRVFRGRPGLDRLWAADGGTLPPSEPSTIVDCTAPEPKVIREGAIPTAVLETEWSNPVSQPGGRPS